LLYEFLNTAGMSGFDYKVKW